MPGTSDHGEATGRALEIIELGAGERVVLVHGDGFGAEAAWEAQRQLARSHHLVMVNRRGFGRSPDVRGQDFDVDADDVAALLGDGCHLVGHSYGGVVALLAAARRPDAVRSLAVSEPPAFALVADRDDVRRFRRAVQELAAGSSPEEFLRGFAVAAGIDVALPEPLPPALVKAARVQMHGRWPWDAPIPLDVLARTSFPKLVVSGGHSAMFDAVCDVLERDLPARREVIPGAGHAIPRLGAPLNDALVALWASAG